MRLAFLGCFFVITAACDGTGRAGERVRSFQVVLDRSASTSAVVPPFVSVVDSIAIVVSTSSGEVVSRIDHHLERREMAFDGRLDLPTGSYVIDAKILSPADSVLYSGSQPFSIRLVDPFGPDDRTPTVKVSLTRKNPLLLVAPDTLVVPVDTTAATGTGTLVVYNRGNSLLTWSLLIPCGKCVVPSLRGGTVPADSSVTITLESIARLSTKQTLLFVSAQGTVPVVIGTVPGG